MTPETWPIWTPWCMVGRIYERDHQTTKHHYILNLLALGLMVSEKKIFEGSLAIELYIYIWPPGVWPVWSPGTWLAGFLKGTTNIATHYKL